MTIVDTHTGRHDRSTPDAPQLSHAPAISVAGGRNGSARTGDDERWTR